MSISLLVSLLREREQRYAHTHEQGPDPPQTVDALVQKPFGSESRDYKAQRGRWHNETQVGPGKDRQKGAEADSQAQEAKQKGSVTHYACADQGEFMQTYGGNLAHPLHAFGDEHIP